MCLPGINPFVVPGFEASEMRPLEPFASADHRGWYVSVDDHDEQVDRFTDRLRNLDSMLDHGQLVLVTGDTGCGKSALLNRCVDLLQQALSTEPYGRACHISDRTTLLTDDRRAQDMSARMEAVRDDLFYDLLDRDVLPADRLQTLARPGTSVVSTYGRLSRLLVRDGRVLIVLLPPTDLPNEIVNYARSLAAGLFFFVESAFLDESQVDTILRRTEKWNTPLHLHVGPLRDGDVARYVRDRLTRNAERGQYPRMSDETVNAIKSTFDSVARLQRSLVRCYQQRLDAKLRYRDSDWVTVEDIRAHESRPDGSGPGTAR